MDHWSKVDERSETNGHSYARDWQFNPHGEPAEEGNQLNLLHAIFGHKFLLVFFVLVGCGLGYLKFLQSPPVYSSSARLRLIQTAPLIGLETLGEHSRNHHDVVDTHVVLMKSPVILDRAIEKLKAAADENGNAEYWSYIKKLTVTRSVESKEIVDLGIQGSDPETCRQILNAVMSSYIGYLSESQGTNTQKMLSLIAEAKDDLLRILTAKEADCAKFRDEASLLWMGEEARNIHANRLSGIEARRAQVMLDRTSVESQMKSIVSLLDRGESREAIILTIEQLGRSNGMSPATGQTATVAQQLMPLLLEEQLLLERFGSGHPKVVEIQKRIEISRSLLESQLPATGGVEAKHRPDVLQVYLQSLQNELKAHDEELAHLNQLFETEEAAAKRLSLEESKYKILREDIGRTKQLFETVLTKMQSAELIKETGSLAAEVVVPPGRGHQVAPVMSNLISTGGIIGLLAGLGIAALIELSDRGYRTAKDIMKHLRVPVIGHIPWIRVDREKKLLGKAYQSRIETSVVTFHRPNCAPAESFRDVRTAMLMAMGGKNRLIQVTSPSPGDGKSTLSANLAVSLARGGKRCLLIDCDFRRPRVHKIFDLKNEVGFSSLIQKQMDLPDAIQRGPIEGLDILASGPKVKNPAELLLTVQFQEILQFVREKYDVVVLDTPPVLAVSDPTVIASQVDGVIVTLKISRNSRPLATRVMETLKMANGNLLGIVVNGIGEDSGYTKYLPYGFGGYGNYGNRYDKYYDAEPDSSHSSPVETAVRNR